MEGAKVCSLQELCRFPVGMIDNLSTVLPQKLGVEAFARLALLANQPCHRKVGKADQTMPLCPKLVRIQRFMLAFEARAF